MMGRSVLLLFPLLSFLLARLTLPPPRGQALVGSSWPSLPRGPWHSADTEPLVCRVVGDLALPKASVVSSSWGTGYRLLGGSLSRNQCSEQPWAHQGLGRVWYGRCVHPTWWILTVRLEAGERNAFQVSVDGSGGKHKGFLEAVIAASLLFQTCPPSLSAGAPGPGSWALGPSFWAPHQGRPRQELGSVSAICGYFWYGCIGRSQRGAWGGCPHPTRQPPAPARADTGLCIPAPHLSHFPSFCLCLYHFLGN